MFFATFTEDDKIRLGHEKSGLILELSEAEQVALELLGCVASRKSDGKDKANYFLKLSSTMHQASLAAQPRLAVDKDQLYKDIYCVIGGYKKRYAEGIIKTIEAKSNLVYAIRSQAAGSDDLHYPTLIKGSYQWDVLRRGIVAAAAGAIPKLCAHTTKLLKHALLIDGKGWRSTVDTRPDRYVGAILDCFHSQLLLNKEIEVSTVITKLCNTWSTDIMARILREGVDAMKLQNVIIPTGDGPRRVPRATVTSSAVWMLPELQA